MQYWRDRGGWNIAIPSVDDLRQKTISYMIDNQHSYTEAHFDGERMVNAPMTKETFEELIQDQGKKGSYTDEDGWFIQANCKMLNIELTIVTNIDSEVLPSGLGIEMIFE